MKSKLIGKQKYPDECPYCGQFIEVCECKIEFEPLRGKLMDLDKLKISNEIKCKGMFYGLDVVSAVEFYKKYRDNPIDLWFDTKDTKEYKELMKRVFNIFEDEDGTIELGTGFNNEKYNNWLFDITFEDVM